MSIKESLAKTATKVGFSLKKYSPEIFIVVGIAGTVTSAILACKATTKIDTILDDTKEKIDAINTTANNPDMAEKYSEEDRKKDLCIVYVQSGVRFFKLYSPSILLGIASLSCVIASNQILKKRNVALMAAYATLDGSFKDYRKRVVKRFGEEVDKDIRAGIEEKTVEEKTIDENGKEKVEKKSYRYMNPEAYSGFARIFDETNANFDRDPYLNLEFLKQQERFANDKLHSKGYLFLNEVYHMLGFNEIPAGQTVGWVLNDKEDSDTDNFVDFGIWNIHDPKMVEFINGEEKAVILDFNIDGVILDTFPKFARS